MEKQEIRFIHRNETFTDVAVQELAKSKAKCICCLQFHRCIPEDCKNCSIEKEYQNCVNAMNDYEKNRLTTYTNDYYLNFSSNPMNYMDHKTYVRHFSKFMFLLYGLPFFLLLILGLVMDEIELFAGFALGVVFIALLVLLLNQPFWQGYRNSKYIDELKRQEREKAKQSNSDEMIKKES